MSSFYFDLFYGSSIPYWILGTIYFRKIHLFIVQERNFEWWGKSLCRLHPKRLFSLLISFLESIPLLYSKRGPAKGIETGSVRLFK